MARDGLSRQRRESSRSALSLDSLPALIQKSLFWCKPVLGIPAIVSFPGLLSLTARRCRWRTLQYGFRRRGCLVCHRTSACPEDPADEELFCPMRRIHFQKQPALERTLRHPIALTFIRMTCVHSSWQAAEMMGWSKTVSWEREACVRWCLWDKVRALCVLGSRLGLCCVVTSSSPTTIHPTAGGWRNRNGQ